MDFDPTCLQVLDDDSPGVLTEPTEVVADEPAPPGRPELSLLDRLARVSESFVTPRLVAAVRVADERDELYVRLLEAHHSAGDDLSAAISAADIPRATEAAQRLSGLAMVADHLPSPLLEDIDSGCVEDALAAAWLRLSSLSSVAAPLALTYRSEMRRFREVSKGNPGIPIDPPPMLPSDKAAGERRDACEIERSRVIAAVTSWNVERAKIGLDPFALLAAASSLAEQLAVAQDDVERCNAVIAAANQARADAGVYWQPVAGAGRAV